MNYDSKKLQSIIEAYTEKRDAMVDRCISEAVDAFDQVVKNINEALYIKVKRLSLYNRWLVLVGSRLYNDSDTSIAAIEQNDTKLSVRINLMESNGQGNNEVIVGSADPQELANVLGFIYKSEEFRIKLRIYSELSSKESFEMTIFALDLHRYTPADLCLSINRNWVVTNFRHKDEVTLPSNSYTAIHQPYKYSDYKEKYGVLNGVIFKVTDATDNGDLIIKFIA